MVCEDGSGPQYQNSSFSSWPKRSPLDCRAYGQNSELNAFRNGLCLILIQVGCQLIPLRKTKSSRVERVSKCVTIVKLAELSYVQFQSNVHKLFCGKIIQPFVVFRNLLMFMLCYDTE